MANLAKGLRAAAKYLTALKNGISVMEDALGTSNREVETSLTRRVMCQVESVCPGHLDQVDRITLEIKHSTNPKGLVRIDMIIDGKRESFESALTLDWDELPDETRRVLIRDKRSFKVLRGRGDSGSKGDGQR